MKRAAIAAFVLFAFGFSSAPEAQCDPALASVPSAFDYAYLVRMAVHFGDAATIPSCVSCSRSLIEGEQIMQVPVWVYNLHEGITRVEFSIASNESLGVFIPDNSLSVVSSARSRTEDSFRLDLVLQGAGPVCGPARIGFAEVHRVAGCDPVWIDLGANEATGRMAAIDANGDVRYVFSPHHGGYIGEEYPYACVEPTCEEPNAPTTGLSVGPDGECRIRVRWNAGGGNCTMIRWSADHFPTDVEDGALAAELLTSPGQSYSVYHADPAAAGNVYYTAFSLTRDASGLIVRDSFAECPAVGYTYMKCLIAADEASWGAIKSIYR